MEYEELLEIAHKNIKPSKECERFEIRKVEGHVEGSKTIISNFAQVTLCLRRKPEHLAKFLFKELATSGELCGDRLIFPRRVLSKEINEKIEKYVSSYVICPNCKKPDTELIEDAGQKYIKCLACGIRRPIANKI